MNISSISQETAYYKGIGEVISEQPQKSFFNFLINYNEVSILNDENDFKNSLIKLFADEINEIFSTNIIISLYKKEYFEALEPKGYILTAYNRKYPLGCYALCYFDDKNEFTVDNEDTIFRLSNNFKGKFSIITKPMDAFSFDNLKENAFENLQTTTQAVAICTKNKDGQYVWGKTFLYPDGLHVQAPLTSTDQYAQSCFEGMVAMVSSQGEIVLLRPYDNALRLIKSAKYLGIPPITEIQFIESVKHAVLSNMLYLPRPGSDEKLYIRPYLKGLEGGYGVGPAYSYAFVVEVFPYGRFVGKKENLLSLVTIDGKRRSHEGGMGAVKASGNYAQTILDRQMAKTGELPGFEGQKFDDVLYWGEAKLKIQIDESELTTVHDVIDEDAAGNIFFIKEIDNKVVLYTPSLSRESILGGFVRDTIIQIAKLTGIPIIEMDLGLNEVEKMTGAFITGSAVGMVRVKSISYKNKVVIFDKLVTQNFTENPTIFTFHELYEVFYSFRKGEIKRVIENPELDKWVFRIGNSKLNQN